MVPSSRLLIWTMIVLLPLFLLAGMDSEWSRFWMAGIGCFVLVLIVDSALSLDRLDGLGVESAKIQRLIQNQEGSLEFFILNASKKARKIRLGWPFPRSIETQHPDLFVKLPPDSAKSRILWPVTPKERGQTFLDKSYLETSSWLGFWDVRKAVSAPVEIRAYPNLSNERKGMAALFLNRGGFGVHTQRQVGKGREFDKLREYVHGDSYADIHWKATARRSHPITKVFQIEKTQEVYVIVDASRLSGRLAGGERADDPHGPKVSMLERFLTASLVLRVAAEKQGDLFGLLTFSDKVHGFLKAKNGRAHYNACRDMLYTLKPRRVTPDFDELFTTIRLKMRRRALLFFLTSLDDPLLAEQFTKNVSLISRQHLILVNMIAPKGAKPLFEEEERPGEVDLYSRLGGHLFWHRLKELEKVLKSRGVNFSLLQNEKFSVELITQYINLKQRQLL
jgi:uncharacterized protein (DUF58 family)